MEGRVAERALVLVGFMGAGKSTAARTVAAELGVGAVDSDRELEQLVGVDGIDAERGAGGAGGQGLARPHEPDEDQAAGV